MNRYSAIFSPSMMCADCSSLKTEIYELEAAGADGFHIDIMDGEFVPNFALSWHDFATIRSMTSKMIDVHLMVKNPAIHLPYVFKHKADIIYIHYEIGNVAEYLRAIKEHGAQAGLAIAPQTKLKDMQHLLPMVDKLLVMRVHPGFAGSPAVLEVEDTILQLTMIKERKFQIVLDGSVSPQVIEKWSAKGVDEFILGTASGLFGPKRADRSYAEVMQSLRSRCNVKELGMLNGIEHALNGLT